MILMKIDICMKKSARIFYGEATKNMSDMDTHDVSPSIKTLSFIYARLI